MLLAFAARNIFFLEECDVSNTYLHENLDIPIIMEKPTIPPTVNRLPVTFYSSRNIYTVHGRPG